MIRNKYIILPFLFIAWTIIFVHSIVPHHHHDEQNTNLCSHCDVQGFSSEEKFQIWDTEHHHTDHVCQFKIETIAHGSIDKLFIANIENSFFKSVIIKETNVLDFYGNFFSDQIPKTKHLRGPPHLSFS